MGSEVLMEKTSEVAGYGDIALPGLCGERGSRDLFWSYSLTLNTSNPDLTVCFQRSVLLWLPCGWLWLASIFYLIYLHSLPRKHGLWHFSQLNFVKSISSLALWIMTLVDLCIVISSAETKPLVDIMYYSVRFVTMFLVLVLTRWEYLLGLHTSGVLSIFWLLQLVADIFLLCSWSIRMHKGISESQPQFFTYCVYFAFVVLSFISQLFSDKKACQVAQGNKNDESTPLLDQDKEPAYQVSSKKAMPNLTKPFWSTVTFLWVITDIIQGNLSFVTFDKLYEIRPFDKCGHLLQTFYSVYNKQSSDGHQRNVKNRFEWALFRAAFTPFITGSLLCVICLGFRVLQPIILGWLITWIESRNPHTWQGVVLAFSLLLCSIITTLIMQNYFYLCWLAGLRARSVTNAVIYRKALRLSGSAKKLTTVGEILNLMAVDAQKLQDMCTYVNVVGHVPLEVALCMGLTWTVMGPSTLTGIVVLALLLPINGFYVAEKIKNLQAKQMVHKDERVKNVNEVLAGMKIIKLYAWEPSFLCRIIDTRCLELYFFRLMHLILAVSNTFWFLIPVLVSLAIFATYVLISPTNILNANMVFVTFSFINVMNFMLSLLPLGFTFLGQGIVSIRRISRFLLMDELEEGVVERDISISDSICIKKASFSWEREGRIALQDVNLNIANGQLIAVVGQVGSGKSSLVAAMLGDMTKHGGNITVNGSLAYVPQQAWIQNATLKENILFGKTYQERDYASALDACALLPDLKILKDGDQTEIGEKGINLSGGQKQRVSLARAVYQNEDIYLLDDPLSAVDAHVGKHIFDKVISNKGILKRKTRILVTHGISFLRQVDVVVVMHDGKISEIGPYEKLLQQNGPFAEFLQNFFKECNGYISEEEKAIHSQLSALSAESDLEVHHETRMPRKIRKNKPAHCESVKKKQIPSYAPEFTPMKLIYEETAEEGKIQWRVIKRFISAGGIPMFILVVVFQVVFTVFQVLTSFWLSEWSADVPNVNGTMDDGLVHMRLGVYGGLGLGQGISAGIMLSACAYGCVTASGNLHSDLIYRIMHAPMAFFDTTPLGRIMNRFSKDFDQIDSNIPIFMRGVLFSIGPIIASAFVVSYTTPIFLAAIIPMVILYIIVQGMYIKYVRQLKRIDNIRRSPIYAHFDETINGASSIRAYRREEEFINKCDMLIDNSQRPFYMIIASQRWLGIAMDAVGGLITFFAALFAVLAKDSLTPSSAGLSISYALNVTLLFNYLIRCMTELETYMVSVERIDEYCNIDQEATWRKEGGQPDPDWPAEGAIKVWDYGTRYRPGLDLVLKNFTCDIASGEKVGIVGRTGAGKSSLALALFRLIEAAEGSISIDGVNISKLGLHNLRSRLTIIPQDPVIFSGTLRMNLDPFNEYSDEEVWSAVSGAHLKSFVEAIPEQLEYECGEGGEALSVGQRQLVCLARALLRQTKVLVLDEATAAMDLETDALIQATIKDMFTECTVLTIAHRLATVLHYDRIMVLDNGSIIEFDKPMALLEKTDSVLHSLAREAGIV